MYIVTDVGLRVRRHKNGPWSVIRFVKHTLSKVESIPVVRTILLCVHFHTLNCFKWFGPKLVGQGQMRVIRSGGCRRQARTEGKGHTKCKYSICPQNDSNRLCHKELES